MTFFFLQQIKKKKKVRHLKRGSISKFEAEDWYGVYSKSNSAPQTPRRAHSHSVVVGGSLFHFFLDVSFLETDPRLTLAPGGLTDGGAMAPPDTVL